MCPGSVRDARQSPKLQVQVRFLAGVPRPRGVEEARDATNVEGEVRPLPGVPSLANVPARDKMGSMMAALAVLDRPTLVLNRRWEPLHLAPVKEAICLVAKGSARVIDPRTFEAHDLRTWADVSRAKEKFGEAVLRSSRMVLVPPEVIVLTRYEGLAERSVVFSRRNLFKRDRYTCQYCGAQPGPESLTVDHVIPRSKGGVSSWTNSVLACLECNKRKADRTPEEAGMRLRKVPKKPSWKTLVQIPLRERRESWEQFLSRAYWETELE